MAQILYETGPSGGRRTAAYIDILDSDGSVIARIRMRNSPAGDSLRVFSVEPVTIIPDADPAAADEPAEQSSQAVAPRSSPALRLARTLQTVIKTNPTLAWLAKHASEPMAALPGDLEIAIDELVDLLKAEQAFGPGFGLVKAHLKAVREALSEARTLQSLVVESSPFGDLRQPSVQQAVSSIIGHLEDVVEPDC